MDSHKAAILSRFQAPLKTEVILAEIVGAKVTVSGGGRDQLVLTLAPVDGDNVCYSNKVSAYFGKPQRGDTPNGLGMLRQKAYDLFCAIDPEFPRLPQKIGQGVYKNPDGTTGPYDAAGAAEVDKAVFDKLGELEVGQDMSHLIGLRVFMKPQKAELDTDRNQVSQFIGAVFGADALRAGQAYLNGDFIDEEKQAEFLAALGVNLNDEEEDE